MEVLVQVEVNQSRTRVRWNIVTALRHRFDLEDIALLKAGGLIWRGDVAFYLEEEK